MTVRVTAMRGNKISIQNKRFIDILGGKKHAKT